MTVVPFALALGDRYPCPKCGASRVAGDITLCVCGATAPPIPVGGVVECGVAMSGCHCGLPPDHPPPHECLRRSDVTRHADGRCHGRWTLDVAAGWLTMYAAPGGLDVPGHPDGIPPEGLRERWPLVMSPLGMFTTRRGGIRYPDRPTTSASYDYLMAPRGLTR